MKPDITSCFADQSAQTTDDIFKETATKLTGRGSFIRSNYLSLKTTLETIFNIFIYTHTHPTHSN